MTLEAFLTLLASVPQDVPLVFETDDGVIGDGYHVTEFKLARITGIDCGARQAQWSEATLQLLDGAGGGHMAAGKFAAIARQSIDRIPDLATVPLQVEFAHGNRGMRIHDLSRPEVRGDAVRVRLGEKRSICKPVMEAPVQRQGAGCCGGGAEAACCA